MSNKSINQLFTKRFRPKSMEHLIAPKRIRDAIGSSKANQNFIFYGSAGTGKTTAAKIIGQNYPTLFINASDETGVDIIREKITNWCSTISLLDNKEQMKLVILDEVDFASSGFFAALRGTIEKFEDTARFIATCNYINKVPDYIQSRLEPINFNYVSNDEEKEIFLLQAKRVKAILNAAKIQIDNQTIKEFVKRNFPDMRKMLNKIQMWYQNGVKEVTIENIKQLNYSFVDIFKLLLDQNPDPYKNYKFLMVNYSSKIDDVLGSLGSEFPNYIKENHPDKISKIPMILIEVANHQAQRNQVIDPSVTMLACAYKLQMILNE